MEGTDKKKFEELYAMLICACNSDKKDLGDVFVLFNPDSKYCYDPAERAKMKIPERVKCMIRLCANFLETESGCNPYIETEFCNYLDAKLGGQGRLRYVQYTVNSANKSYMGLPSTPSLKAKIKSQLSHAFDHMKQTNILGNEFDVEIGGDQSGSGSLVHVDVKLRTAEPIEYFKTDIVVKGEGK